MHKSQRLWLAPLILTACTAEQASEPPNGPGNEPAISKPNPAAVYCIEQGGSYDLETGQCTTAEGETVDAWAYFRSSRA